MHFNIVHILDDLFNNEPDCNVIQVSTYTDHYNTERIKILVPNHPLTKAIMNAEDQLDNMKLARDYFSWPTIIYRNGKVVRDTFYNIEALDSGFICSVSNIPRFYELLIELVPGISYSDIHRLYDSLPTNCTVAVTLNDNGKLMINNIGGNDL